MQQLFHHRLVTFIIIPLMVLGLGACKQGIVFEKSQSVNKDGWHYQDTVFFEHEFTDTLALYDIYLNVRNTDDYPYRNFYVFFETTFPDGRVFRDTIETFLADRTGQWTGSGLGRTKSNSFHFRKDVWFPVEGEFTFSIQHAMREEYLEGISDIGIRIERK